jgi:protein SCO1/2
MTRRRSAAIGAALLLLLGILVAAGCGGGDTGDGAAAEVVSVASEPEHLGHTGTVPFEGGTISPMRAAPPLVGKDIDGKTVDIRDLKGHPVLVTFVYANCPDVCPLIMTNLRQVREKSDLGKQMRVIAVSVDPKGDTVPTVRKFLQRQRVGGFVDYVVGDRAQLEPLWANWQVATQVPKDNPELIEHSSLIYGVTASGELATAYPVGFEPDAIVRDLDLLASN